MSERERNGTKADFHVNDSSFCSEPLHFTRMFPSTGKRRTLTFSREFVSSQRWLVPLHSVEAWRNQHHVRSELIRNRHHHRPLKKDKNKTTWDSERNSSAKKRTALFIHRHFYYLLSLVEIFLDGFSTMGTFVPLDIENNVHWWITWVTCELFNWKKKIQI